MPSRASRAAVVKIASLESLLVRFLPDAIRDLPCRPSRRSPSTSKGRGRARLQVGSRAAMPISASPLISLVIPVSNSLLKSRRL